MQQIMTDNLPFTLIDNQNDFIVINKNADISFHDEGAINNGLFNQIKKTLSIEELYPIHRLDKMTSGLLIFAKNLNTAQQFQQLFSNHEIEKYYLAISDKKPSKKQGLIKGDMAKSRRGTWKLLRSNNNPSITQFFSYAIGDGKRLYLLKPHSGKTHQIRVALNSIGAPILGDSYYYPNNEKYDFDRGYLHAFALRFQLNGQQYRYLQRPSQGFHFNNDAVVKLLASLIQPESLLWPKI